MCQTPYFVFDIDNLENRLAYMRKCLDDNGMSKAQSDLCYAVKANPFLVKKIEKYISKFEVCSKGELDICEAYGIPYEKIILSGVNKEEELIKYAILNGISIITVESELQYQYIKKQTKELNRKTNVILRLTNGSQFGIDQGVLEGIIENRSECKEINIIGIHYFTGTQKKKHEKILEELDMLSGLIHELHFRYGFNTELLEFGPGLCVPYFEGENFDEEFKHYSLLISYIRDKHYSYNVTLEMGRFIAASCGKYVTSVVDIKCNSGLNVCIVDGGKNHLNYYGQNMAMRIPVIDHIHNESINETEWKEWSVFGSLCNSADILVRKIKFNNLKTGDRLVFNNVGAYSVTEGIYLFLSRKMPDIYFKSVAKGLTLERKGMETSLINQSNHAGDTYEQ